MVNVEGVMDAILGFFIFGFGKRENCVSNLEFTINIFIIVCLILWIFLLSLKIFRSSMKTIANM